MNKDKDDDINKEEKVQPDDETKEIPFEPLDGLDDLSDIDISDLIFPEDNIDHPSAKGLDVAFIEEVERQIQQEEAEFLNLNDIEFYFDDEDSNDDEEFEYNFPEELDYENLRPPRIPKLKDYDVVEEVSDHLGDGLMNPILIDNSNRLLFGWVDISVRMAVITKLKGTPGCGISPVEIYAGTVIKRNDIVRKLYVQEFKRLKADIFETVVGNRGKDVVLNHDNHLSFYETTIRKVFEYLKYIDYQEMFKET